jgi:hypothetical protein
MSLNRADDFAIPRVILRTGDQFALWKERVAATCWAATRLDVFSLSDDDCDLLIQEHHESKSDKLDKIGKCYLTITSLLSDEVFVKVAHVQKGKLASLIGEIRAALAVNAVDDINPLRVELYAASMVKDCKSDLQTYISFIITRKDKLAFLKSEVPEHELIHIFLKGLSPVFNPIQVHFAIPGTLPKDFRDVVAIVRRFSNNPLVSAELARSRAQPMLVSMAPTLHGNNARDTVCKMFTQNGTCRFGTACKFSHGAPNPAVPSNSRSKAIPTCFYCKKRGHLAAVCRKKQADTQKGEVKHHTVSLLSDDQSGDREDPYPDSDFDESPIVLVFTAHFSERVFSTLSGTMAGWICDSGATSNATYDQSECVDVHDCCVQVTAAGCTFEVSKRGTAIIQVLDTKGRAREMRLTNCLISDKFPYKLLALQSFTNKGHTVLFKDKHMIVKSGNSTSFCAKQDDTSKLYVLPCVGEMKNKAFHCDVTTPCTGTQAAGALSEKSLLEPTKRLEMDRHCGTFTYATGTVTSTTFVDNTHSQPQSNSLCARVA